MTDAILLEVNAFRNQKFGALSEGERFRWTNAVLWCREQRTDGWVPRRMWKELRLTPKLIEKGVESGLFLTGTRPNAATGREEAGLELVDYLERNPARAEIERREANARGSRLVRPDSQEARRTRWAEQKRQQRARVSTPKLSADESAPMSTACPADMSSMSAADMSTPPLGSPLSEIEEEERESAHPHEADIWTKEGGQVDTDRGRTTAPDRREGGFSRPLAKSTPRAAVKNPLPDAFELTPAMREMVAKVGERAGVELDAEYEFARFVAHYRASGHLSADWRATWDKWVLGAPRYASPAAATSREAPEPPPPPARRPVFAPDAVTPNELAARDPELHRKILDMPALLDRLRHRPLAAGAENEPQE